MKRYFLIAFAALAFAGGASAQNPADLLANDLNAIGGNLGPTVDALAHGLGNTANTLISTQSAVQTEQAFIDTIDSTAAALVDDTTDEFALRQAVSVPLGGFDFYIQPLLTAVDNPTQANIQAVNDTILNPNQLTTIAENVQSALTAVWIGQGPGFFTNPYGTGAKALLLKLLEGDLIKDGFFSDFGAARLAITTLTTPVGTLLTGTHTSFAIGNTLAVPPSVPAKTTALNQLLQKLEVQTQQFADAFDSLATPAENLIKASKFNAGNLTLPSTSDFLAAFGAGSL